MERASLEFEELGQSLNGLTGALWRTKTSTPKTPRSRVKGGAAKQEVSKDAGLENAVPPEAAVMHEMNPVEALQAGTVNSIRKVAQDVSALAAVRGFLLKILPQSIPDVPSAFSCALVMLSSSRHYAGFCQYLNMQKTSYSIAVIRTPKGL